MTVKSVLAGAALGVALVTGGAQAATLIGQEVTCTTSGAAGTCSPSPFTITAGAPTPDAQVFTLGTALLDIDFMDGWVDITFNGEGTAFGVTYGTPALLTLSGLLPPSGAETTIRNLSITNITGLTPEDFSLSGGVLTIDLSGSDWRAANGSAVGFDVAVPLPASALLLLGGLAGLGLASRRRTV